MAVLELRTSLLLLALLLLPVQVHAQVVRGRAVTSDGTPARGATVLLIDSLGARRGGSFTDEQGSFVIRAPRPGRYTLELQRIGLRTTKSAPLELVPGEAMTVQLSAPLDVVELPEIAAIGKRQCVRRGNDAQVAAVWEEARKALTATALAASQDVYRFKVRRFSRRLSWPAMRITSDTSVMREGMSDARPFKSFPADSLIEHGFIQDLRGGTYYHAPDAEVLLSETFANAFCFRLTGNRDADLIGLSFEPSRRNYSSSIEGTLWIDRKSAALRSLEYHYVGSQLPRGAGNAIGGVIEFKRLPSGAWIVDRWHIRTPVLTQVDVAVPRGAPIRRFNLTGLSEEGGEVLEVLTRDNATIFRGQLGAVQVEVRDSATQAPLVGATVFLVGTGYAATTNESGVAVIDSLPPGEFELSYAHPLLLFNQHIAAATPISVVSGAQLRRTVIVPAYGQISGCSFPEDPRLRGVLVGALRHDTSYVPLPGAQLTISWSDGTAQRVTTTDTSGRFVICGLPIGEAMIARASHFGRTAAPAAVDSIGSVGFRAVELDFIRTAHATVTMRLTDWTSRQPISNATVTLPDVGVQTTSDARGAAVFTSVPAGLHKFRLEHVAYGTFEDTLRVSGPTVAEVRVPERAIALRPLEVVVRSAVETARRTRGTRADILTREDIAKMENRAFHVGDLVKHIPSLRVFEIRDRSGLRRGVCIESMRSQMELSAKGCNSVLLVVDGIVYNTQSPARDVILQMLLDLPPNMLESVEYLSSAEAGPRYGTGSAQGALVIYTRGNGPYAKRP